MQNGRFEGVQVSDALCYLPGYFECSLQSQFDAAHSEQVFEASSLAQLHDDAVVWVRAVST